MCASYYNNRAAAYMMLDKYKQALDDVQEALRLNDKLVKVGDQSYQALTKIFSCPTLL